MNRNNLTLKYFLNYSLQENRQAGKSIDDVFVPDEKFMIVYHKFMMVSIVICIVFNSQQCIRMVFTVICIICI